MSTIKQRLTNLAPAQKHALQFILLLGVVSMFADITYEGARSITGPYLAILGANATIVGFVAGFGELIGYSIRLVSGYLTDRTKQYWLITFFGYAINLLAVPLLALTDHWPAAAVLIIFERLGKAIRTPARDAMLSYAGQSFGMGFGFGINEALDHLGAMLGPLIVALVLYTQGSYQEGFALLLLPALLALIVLVIAFRHNPHPEYLVINSPKISTKGMDRTFRLYIIGAALIAAGFADFPLIAYHFEKTATFPKTMVPIVYGIAMGVNALSAPFLGHWYDKRGVLILIIITAVSALFAPLVFLGGESLALLGMILWAIGLGAQESLMRAIIGNMVAIEKRATAYGVFNMAFGLFWFLGSVLMGILYDYSIAWLVLFILILEFASIPWLIKVRRATANAHL
jgi:predicted MFS family arabinose efflux permease